MGKTGLVTGGTSGIGAGIAREMLSHFQPGDRLYVNYGHNKQGAEEFYKGLLPEQACLTELLQADLSSSQGLCALLSQLPLSTWEGLDYLICNAGTSIKKPFEDYQMEEWEGVLRTNLTIPTFLVKNLLPHMKEGGSILFVGSYAGEQAYSSSLAYGVSKAGVHFLARSLVKETEKKGIRVNAVSPGFINTRWHAGRSEESTERINKKIALHRFGEVEEVARLSWEVLTNGYMNGSVVSIHGGYDYF